MIGHTLSHYRIDEPLGAGGMGVVYRAHDLHLERDVALKVLPAGALADESARQRFRKEALTLSRLNHPHIATVYDFDSQDGVDFLVMELVPGHPLSERLAAGPLSEADIRDLGAQIAEALEAAHERGVVHRDLKPANILLGERGQVKVLDFGIAKLVHTGPGPHLTRSLTEVGVAVGTLPYMAPEQLLGRAVDARVDLYALGVVLYELAAGRLPWKEKVATALIYEIADVAPPPLRELRPDLSPALEAIIGRCLEKEPEARFASAREVREALRGEHGAQVQARAARRPTAAARPRRWLPAAVALGLVATLSALLLALDVGGLRERLVSGAGAGPIRALAVLPLENLSRDSTQDYFVDGMTDELIVRLSEIAALRVRPRTSVMIYKGTHLALAKIASELRVDAVVSGSVLRSGNRARISAQLIRVKDQENLWADSFDGELKDAVALQNRVARAIAQRIRVRLSAPERARLADAHEVNPRAHEAYLRGRYAEELYTEEGFRQAIRHFKEAIAADPAYAPGYSGLAEAYTGISSIYVPAREAMPRARAAALKALEIDPTLADGYNALGYVTAFYEWKWSAAELDFRKAIELSPGSALIHRNYAYFLFTNRRFAEAKAELDRAREIDPLSSYLGALEGILEHLQRRYDSAIRVLNDVTEADSGLYIPYVVRGQCYIWKQEYALALVELKQAHRLENSPGTLAWLGYAYATSKDRAAALDVLKQLRERSRTGFVSPAMFAVVYAALGDHDSAFEWLNKGISDRAEEMCNVLNDPGMDPLRSDPRFDAIIRQIGLTPLTAGTAAP